MMDRSEFKYKIPCIVLVENVINEDTQLSKDVIRNLAFNINGVFYPYYQYNENTLELFDHTLGEDESFNKVGYYYTNDQIKLTLSSLALDYYLVSDEFLNPEYLNKQHNNTINSLNNQIADLKNQLSNALFPDNDPYVKGELFIDIFRISPDGKYLEIDMTTGNSYMFKSVNIYNYTTKDKYYDVLAEIDQNDLIEIYTGNSKQYRLLVRIDIELLGGSSLYYGSIEVEKFEGEPEEIIDSNKIFEVATSDISNVYFYLLPGLVQLKNPCDPCDLEIPIEIQRAFLIMWAHIEAMRLERWAEAEMFYDLIKNNFQHCLSVFEVKPKSCNCHAKKQSNFNYRR